MKARHLLVAALAAAALSGCVTYDHAGARAPGGYYSGRASTDYYYGPYGARGYYGYGYPSYGYYGHGYYGHGYYGYPYSRYPYYPYPSRPHHPRPPRPDHDGDRDDNRPPPWRGPGGNADARPRPPVQSIRPLRPETEGRAPWRGGNAIAQPAPQRAQPMARPQREVRSAPAPRRQEGGGWRRPQQQEP